MKNKIIYALLVYLIIVQLSQCTNHFPYLSPFFLFVFIRWHFYQLELSYLLEYLASCVFIFHPFSFSKPIRVLNTGAANVHISFSNDDSDLIISAADGVWIITVTTTVTTIY